MTIEEYKTKLTEAVKTPDKAPAAVNEVLEELTKDFTTLSSLIEENGRLSQKVRDLQDANVRLFLSVTDSKKEEPEEKTEEQKVEEFINKLKGGEE